MFLERHTDWAAAEEILMKTIKEREAGKKTRKVPWLTSRDVTKKEKNKEIEPAAGQQAAKKHAAGQIKETSGDGPAGQVTNVDTQSAGQTVVDTPAVPS